MSDVRGPKESVTAPPDDDVAGMDDNEMMAVDEGGALDDPSDRPAEDVTGEEEFSRGLAAGTSVGGMPGTGGGQGAAGDLKGPGETDPLGQMGGEVPKPVDNSGRSR